MSSPLNRPRNAPEARENAAAPGASPAVPAERMGAAAGEAPVQPLPPRADSGLLSLPPIASHYRIAADPFQLSHDLGLGSRAATSEDIVRAAKRVGLKSRL